MNRRQLEEWANQPTTPMDGHTVTVTKQLDARDVADTMLAQAGEDGDISPETADLLRAFVPSVDPDAIGAMIQDAMTARALLDAGDTEGAREIVERYRSVAESCGMGPAFDAMFADILAD